MQIEQFHALRGQRIFLSGQSGSGKSTLLSIIGGVIQPQQGRVEILGQNTAQMGQSKRDAFRVDHIGFIFQQFNLIPYLSVIDNVVLPCVFSKKRLNRLKSTDSLSFNAVPQAKQILSRLDILENVWSRPVSQLSVGQQQRVSIARALIGSPEIIIADEPTSALDEHNQQLFLDLLMQECALAHTCLIFASHDLRLVDQFDSHVNLAQINNVKAQSA